MSGKNKVEIEIHKLSFARRIILLLFSLFCVFGLYFCSVISRCYDIVLCVGSQDLINSVSSKRDVLQNEIERMKIHHNKRLIDLKKSEINSLSGTITNFIDARRRLQATFNYNQNSHRAAQSPPH